jgi:hypothetical protein
MTVPKQHLTADEYKQVKERLALVTTHLPKDDYTLRGSVEFYGTR